jgi:hypothetical protein
MHQALDLVEGSLPCLTVAFHRLLCKEHIDVLVAAICVIPAG